MGFGSGVLTGLIAIDGQVFSPEKAAVSAFDRGLLFGDAVFEVMVAFGNKILDLDAHLERLHASAAAIALEIPWSNQELSFEVQSLIDQLSLPKGYVRLMVTRGDGLGLKIRGGERPRRITYCMPAAHEPADLYRDGLALKRMIKEDSSRGAKPKTASYLHTALALKRAATDGFDEILWSNSDGEISEAATANIFFLAREGDLLEIVTPPAQSGILLGITRGTIMRLLQQAKIPVHEQIIFADELPRFDEAFLCSTVRGLVPIHRIDNHRLHSARPQSSFRHVERLFQTWVATEIGHRVDWATGRPTGR
ncbi:branched chain amino acid aminotransferase [Planctomyces bekefii]|uniref:branched-chain-amino-acid transaminase n=1 Tax=Planctomyces bekefii TaxID=1653850 RepID=A0A5C6M5Z7_9PLAN|nr:branched chain amino acid aminotransferase [Planctomyces bekefii]